jgi:ankyrin repeat protein
MSSSAPARGHKRERAESPAADRSHSRCGKKTSRRTEDADPSSSQSLPVAPTLAAFLAPGGATRYRPQPAWLAPAATTTTRKSRRHHDYPDILAAAVAYEANETAAAAVGHETAAAANDWSPYESLSRLVWGVPPDLHATGLPVSATPTTNHHTTEPALWTAIRESATEAALALLAAGAPLGESSTSDPTTTLTTSPKVVIPLVLAAQKGQLAVVQALLDRGACPRTNVVRSNGSTALLQAAHFGHAEVVELLLAHGGGERREEDDGLAPSTHDATAAHHNHHPDTDISKANNNPLVEMANLNLTTPLMRAAQEGHGRIVTALLCAGARVNRRNRSQMSALMLASQRGHATICQTLIRAGANMDARTNQDSTSLLLACKRCHVAVVRVLVTAGCELWVKDTRGRTARNVASRRLQQEQHTARRAAATAGRTEEEDNASATRTTALKAMLELMDSSVQRHLMRCRGRQIRSLTMISHWHLLQQERALVWLAPPPAFARGTPGRYPEMRSLAQIVPFLDTPKCDPRLRLPSTKALLRTMTLPAPLVQLITSFMPLPPLWARTIGMLTKRATLHPEETVTSALDLVDEILEEGGLVEAMDEARLEAPPLFGSWRKWKASGRCKGHIRSERSRTERPNVTLAVMVPPALLDRPSLLEHRRTAAFLSVMARSPALGRVLQSSAYQMPAGLWAELVRTSDLASLVRRMGSNGGIHFDSAIAMDLVMLASRLCSWYWRRSENLFVLRPADTHN